MFRIILIYFLLYPFIIRDNKNLTMKISLLEINMNPKIELKIISTLNKTLLLSKPNYYPILIISLYDLNGKPYSPSKIHSSIILKKEVFNLEVNKEKIFEYKSLKSLYPFKMNSLPCVSCIYGAHNPFQKQNLMLH